MTATILWINAPFMAIAFALWVGVPMWLVLRHPDRHPGETRVVPEYLKHHPHFKHHPAVAPVAGPAPVRRERWEDTAGHELQPAP